MLNTNIDTKQVCKGKIYRMTPQKGGSSEFKPKEEAEFVQATNIQPNKTYYIRPTMAPRFYETEFSPQQHINQINDLVNAGKVWQKI